VLSGDLEAARVAHTTAGTLLATAQTSDATAGQVVDLARERERRGR